MVEDAVLAGDAEGIIWRSLGMSMLVLKRGKDRRLSKRRSEFKRVRVLSTVS